MQTYLKERIREVLTGSSETIVVHIFGDDLDTLKETAEDVLGRIKKVDGVVEANIELQDDVPQVEVEVDLATAQALRAEAGRRAPCRGDPRRQRGGRRHLPGRQGVRRARVDAAGRLAAT